MNNQQHFRIWKGKTSMEVFTLEYNDQGLVAGGIINDVLIGKELGIRYKIIMDALWKISEVNISSVSNLDLWLQFKSDGKGQWLNGLGQHLPELDGCLDVDISATPFTNSIPIQKMDNRKKKRFKVLYINAEDFSFDVVEQVYTNMGAGKYRYENMKNKFSIELNMDDYGLLEEYPGYFKTVYTSD